MSAEKRHVVFFPAWKVSREFTTTELAGEGLTPGDLSGGHDENSDVLHALCRIMLNRGDLPGCLDERAIRAAVEVTP